MYLLGIAADTNPSKRYVVGCVQTMTYRQLANLNGWVINCTQRTHANCCRQCSFRHMLPAILFQFVDKTTAFKALVYLQLVCNFIHPIGAETRKFLRPISTW